MTKKTEEATESDVKKENVEDEKLKQEQLEKELELKLEQEKARAAEEARKQEKVSITRGELEKLENEARDFKSKYFLGLAEQENARKRMQKERDDNRRYAVQGVLLDILHPLDHLEQALGHSDNAPEEVQHWAVGFKMILTQFKDALSNHGVKPFDSKGKQFDPHLHEAIEAVETDDVPPDTIIDEQLKGYTIGEKH